MHAGERQESASNRVRLILALIYFVDIDYYTDTHSIPFF